MFHRYCKQILATATKERIADFSEADGIIKERPDKVLAV